MSNSPDFYFFCTIYPASTWELPTNNSKFIAKQSKYVLIKSYVDVFALVHVQVLIIEHSNTLSIQPEIFWPLHLCRNELSFRTWLIHHSTLPPYFLSVEHLCVCIHLHSFIMYSHDLQSTTTQLFCITQGDRLLHHVIIFL